MNCAVHTQTQAVAFCRTCGKALCEDCKRDVMGAIYCEPCIAARLGHAAPPPVSAMPPMPPAPPPPHVPGAPNPVIALILGLIPGVGAMYNGQFVKAFAHVVIFVMLIIAASNVHWAFGWMIAFFVLYMAFEAYKTAEARRLGIPAPDPLGLDKMFGVQESRPPASIHSSAAVVDPAGTAAAPGAPMSPPPVQIAPPPPPPADSAPVGAIVLLVLGFFFLLSNFELVHIGRLWPLVLIGFGLWIAYKRTSQGT
ncbi:MAG TPA: B-box zinc finger protein [Candidatus Angelobacter sp.]|nr:B-box zinc finger protein [Candidatus Angelobacter sp.]